MDTDWLPWLSKYESIFILAEKPNSWSLFLLSKRNRKLHSFSFLHWRYAIIHKNIGRLAAGACSVAVYLSYILCFLVYFSVLVSYILIFGWIFKEKCRKCLYINYSTLLILQYGLWILQRGLWILPFGLWIWSWIVIEVFYIKIRMRMLYCKFVLLTFFTAKLC